MLRSSTGAECVSAPIEIEVDAGRRDLGDVVEGDPSRRLEPRRLRRRVAGGDRAPAARPWSMLSSSRRSAPEASAVSTSAALRHSTSTGSPGWAAGGELDRAAQAAGAGDVVLLDQDRVVEPEAVVAPAARRRPPPSRARAARASSCGCRGSSPRAGDRRDVAGGQRRDAGEVAEEVQRRALGGEQGAGAGRRSSRSRPGRPRATRPRRASASNGRPPPARTPRARRRGRTRRPAASGRSAPAPAARPGRSPPR